MKDDPDFRQFNISNPPECCPILGLRRTFKSGSYNYDEFDISIQVGRSLTDIDVIGLAGSVSVSRALQDADLSFNHLVNTPQALHATNEESTPLVPVLERREDALAPH